MIKKLALIAASAFTAIALAGGFAYAAQGVIGEARAQTATLEERVEALEQQVGRLQQASPHGVGLGAAPGQVKQAVDPIGPFLDKDDPAPAAPFSGTEYTVTYQADYTRGDRAHVILKVVYADGPSYTWDDFVDVSAFKADPDKVIAPLVKRMLEIKTTEATEALQAQRKALPAPDRVALSADRATVDAKLAEIAAELEAARVAK